MTASHGNPPERNDRHRDDTNVIVGSPEDTVHLKEKCET